MTDIKTEAQKFMSQHGIAECYEAGDKLYKHKENAEATGKNIIVHTLNAGPKKPEKENE